MNEVIAGIRKKYPGAYDSLDDDELTLKIADKYPQYLTNASFSEDVKRLSTSEGIPKFNPKGGVSIANLTPEEQASETELAESQAHPLTTPIAKIIPKFAEESLGRIATLPAAIARDWYEATPETRTAPEQPVNPSLKEKALYAVANNAPSDKAIAIATGVQHASADIGNFFTSPLGIATLGIGSLPAAAQRAVALGFAATMAKDVPQIASDLGTELGKPEDQRDYQKIAELTSQGIANTGFAAAGAAHGAAKPIAEKLGAYPAEKGATPNAIPERSAETVPVETPPGDSGTVGARIPEPEKAADAQGAVEQPQTTPDVPTKEAAPDNVTSTVTQDKGMFSMGGLAPSDPLETAGKEGGNPDIYGIAERVREERAKAGQVAEVPPGEGITPQESIAHGRDLLAKDPTGADKTLSAFEADPNKAVSADAMALVRAKGEDLAITARRIEERYGTESAEYKAAWKALSDWDTRTKPMQTEWHKIGQAQQGETDLDTGSFTGLQRAFKEATGEEFTREQGQKAKQRAASVTRAADKLEAAKQTLFTELDRQAIEGAAKTAKESNEQAKAAQRALDAASKTVRDAAARLAEAENKQRVATAAREKATAREQAKAAQKQLDRAHKAARDAAVKAARAEVSDRVNPERIVWRKAKDYIEKGADGFDDIRNKIATDLGMPIKKVTELLVYSKRAKFLANDLWKKQQVERHLRQQARQWLSNLEVPMYKRALASIPKVMFSLKVGFHGTVALGTHAPMVAFQPRFWATYARDFGKMYRMVGNKAYYERQVQDLLRRPNYITARRAGLVNDPFVYEDYNSPETSKYFGKLTGMGNRGYSVLKILRQDMFDQMWSKLPRTAQIPEVAEAIADGLNHATGVVQGKAPKGSNVVLFAPRLLASRVMWLAVDPMKAADTFLRWNEAGPGEKRFAIHQLKEKAWVAGTLFALLAINQGILDAVDSEQKINFTDPFKGDFLKFKAAGMTISYGNAMLTMARLPVRLFKIRSSDGGKLKNLVYPDEDTYSVLGEYARSQLSPFASLALTLWLKADWQNRPLPNSDRPVPKRLRARGEIPYTWPEFWTEQVLPIPAEEATREVWRHGLGMNDDQIKAMRKAMATIAVMSATGARLTEDTDVSH